MNTPRCGNGVIDLLRAIHRQLELVDRTSGRTFSWNSVRPLFQVWHDDQEPHHGHRPRRQVDLAALVRIPYAGP